MATRVIFAYDAFHQCIGKIIVPHRGVKRTYTVRTMKRWLNSKGAVRFLPVKFDRLDTTFWGKVDHPVYESPPKVIEKTTRLPRKKSFFERCPCCKQPIVS